MLLAIDVGNTNIVIGVFDGDLMLSNFRISTDKQKSSDEIGIMLLQLLSIKNIDPENIDATIISSVVPPIMHSLNNAIRNYLGHEPIIIDEKIKTGLTISYDKPREVGADRIVNAVAAHDKYSGDLIIVDFGTATTFCALTSDGNYLGGVITAGIKISMEALFVHAAKLPRIEIAKPRSVIGKTTADAVQSGAVYGYTGQVDFIVQKMKKELCGEVKVIATGGLAGLIASESSGIDVVDRFLTLDGLRILYKMNT